MSLMGVSQLPVALEEQQVQPDIQLEGSGEMLEHAFTSSCCHTNLSPLSSPRKGTSQTGAPVCEEDGDAGLGIRQGGKAPVTPRGRGRRGRPPSRTTGTRYLGSVENVGVEGRGEESV